MNDVIPIVDVTYGADKPLHTCPYKTEINGDYETLCDCDEDEIWACNQEV